MDLISKEKVKNELEIKFYKTFEKERMFMKDDLEKILKSFECNFSEKEDSEKLEKEKQEAYETLDIKKIKTLNL